MLHNDAEIVVKLAQVARLEGRFQMAREGMSLRLASKRKQGSQLRAAEAARPGAECQQFQ